MQGDSLPAETPGKPKTGVGSLSLLQGVFPTQESNLGLLHCRGILYQLSYQGMWGISEIQASDASGEEAGFGVTGTLGPPQADWVTSGIP